jgi:hypothetical protein
MSDLLKDYEPRMNGGFLMFICPACGEHSLRVAICPTKDHNDRCWSMSGELPNVTVTPSINFEGHWHKNITEGKFT